MYLGNKKDSAKTGSWIVVETWTELSWTDELETSTDTEEVAAPTLTPEQAREELQKMLSGSGE